MLGNRYKFTVHSHFVLPALRAAQGRGIGAALLLEGTGLSPAVLAEPQVRFTAEQYNVIIRRLWRLLDDENVGLLPRSLPLGAFRAACELALNAPTLEGMFRKLVRDYRLVAPYIRSEFEIVQGRATFAFNFLGFEDDSRVSTEWTLLSWHRFACWAVGRSFPLRRVSFRYPRPDYADEYAKVFGCPCGYGARRQELVFDAQYLPLRIVRSHHELGEFLGDSPGILLAVPSHEEDIVLQVRRLLMSGGRYDAVFPRFDRVAAGLKITGKTLGRRLRTAGTSYQKIKDGIRRDLSIELLADPQRPIAQIAEAVGFSDASSFSRAFKDWTGVPPNAYRNG